MASRSQHGKGTGVRRAANYVPVVPAPVNRTCYPARSNALIGAIHNAAYHQGLLANKDNFISDSHLSVIEHIGGKVERRDIVGEQECQRYFQDMVAPQKKTAHGFRAIFCEIERANQTSFGCRLSLSDTATALLLDKLQISPQFLGHMLGEPDYWSPGDFARYDRDGKLAGVEAFSQQPRWHLHTQDMPLSTHMMHELATKNTTYLIVCNKQHARLQDIQKRLVEVLGQTEAADATDPFMLHLLVVHETFLDAKSVITPLRYQLYDQLDRVDKYAQEPSLQRLKAELEDMTIRLHVVSQELDSMTASADMTGMIVRRLLSGHERYQKSMQAHGIADATTRTTDALHWLAESVESQRRWLLSYKSRKDIAMNLVYNLVTQQDAVTSTTIAREARADGNSMKVIAALTMVFLPGTYLSSVFGMAMVKSTVPWWLYVALTVPLTIVVFLTWWMWQSYSQWSARWSGWFTKKHAAKAGNSIAMSPV